MYTSFFGLSEKPFAITPDPRYLYLSERHTEALAHLAYGISEAGGFIQLTGEVGTGKTTVLRSLLQQLPPHCDVALILNPRVTPAEFLLAICDELHVGVPPGDDRSVKALVDLLTHFLLDAHGRNRRIVLMVDEAQNLDADVLEQVRLLTNLETATQKLLQIILIGQPELREVLARPELRQLAQRITGRYHLEALRKRETLAYIRHRLRVAGVTRDLFTGGAQRELHRLAGGVPRIINVIADRALLGAYTREQNEVNGALVRRAASEVYGRPVLAPWLRWLAIGGSAVGAVLLAFVLWRAWPASERPDVAAQAVAAVPDKPVDAPKPATPPREPLGALLAKNAATNTMDAAFTTLFSLWGAQFQPGAGIACEQANANGLACVWQRGSLAQLKLINRPAILSLIDEKGTAHQVVLTSLGNDGARLLIGGGQASVPVTELSDFWFGEFLVLWKPQSTFLRPLRAGMRGDDVRWLRQGLEQLAGTPATPDTGDYFDAELQQLVENFQRSRRLAVDGVAGLQTQLVLDSALGLPGTPTLAHAGPQAGA
ncbi:MAG TPA: AAA family ATPase [Steroidobacteraceae bacterium]|jgi:general secretion pathway protein A|nr:AAA family ATPase [Steroidobacteraceae bacterium]